MLAVKRYGLLDAGDRIAVTVGEDASSLLLAELLHILQRFSEAPFTAVFCAESERAAMLAKGLGLELTECQATGPEMAAQALGCNKLAVADCMEDAVETEVNGLFWTGELRALPPMEQAEDVWRIRPLYRIARADIAAWARRTELDAGLPQTRWPNARTLIDRMKETTPDVEKSLFSSLHAVCPETLPGGISVKKL